MKRFTNISNNKGRLYLCLILVATLFILQPSDVLAKIYIDITSPSIKKLPMAVYDLQGTSGREISDIIRDDINFTGLFMCIDKASYVESVSQPFSRSNWTPLGVEAVVKGQMIEGSGLTATVSLYDVFEGKEILKRQFHAEKDDVRAFAHTIANDIYAALTGQQGIFRTKIAFAADDGQSKSIYTMDWDGHASKRMGLKASLVLTPHWSRDGSRIVYASERGRQWGLYLLDFSRMTEKKIFSSKGTNMAGDFFPDGERLVFSSSKDGTPDIFVLDIAKGQTIRKLASSPGIEVSPAVSPDSNQIAFVSDRGGSPQIYLMRSDGSEVRRVSFEGAYNTSPSWSPAGDKIVFACRRGNKNQICLLAPDGSGLMQLTEIGSNEDPSFSPDGRYIVFSSDRDGQKGIYVMRSNGENQKRITPKGLKAFGPRWSPN